MKRPVLLALIAAVIVVPAAVGLLIHALTSGSSASPAASGPPPGAYRGSEPPAGIRLPAFSLRDYRNAHVGRKTMLIPWLEDFSLTSERRPASEVWAQIRAARKYQTRGFLLWNPTGVYTEEVLK